MEKWAKGPLGAQVDFYCICVDTREVAKNFGQIFQFTKAVNGWISSRNDMPSFGQLGCSGFIIIGVDGRCITRATAPFLRVGPEAAFRNAEQIMSLALPRQDMQALDHDHPYAAGHVVRIEGLTQRKDLNGAHATVVSFDALAGRFIVEYDEMALSGAQGVSGAPRLNRVALRPCSLAPVTGALVSAPAPTAAVPLRRVELPPSVGCAEIDDEHASCTAALNALLDAAVCVAEKGADAATKSELKSLPTLFHAALLTLEEHFEHEESLAAAAGFGASTGVSDGVDFSAFKSHAVDHARILRLAREGEARARTSSSTTLADAQELASAFATHAADFDTLLEGRLASAV